MQDSQKAIFRKEVLDRFEDTGNPKDDVRQFLRKCVEPDRLYSLDEIAGVVSTVATVTLAFLALVLSDFRLILGVLTAVTSVFFWIGYRVGKIKHAIDIRFAVVLSFEMFLYVTIVLSLVLFIVGPELQLVNSLIAASLVIVVTFTTLKPAIQIQDALCKWLLYDDIVRRIENDEEFEKVVSDSFRGRVDASQSNAFIAGFLAIFFFYPFSYQSIFLILGINIISLFLEFRYGTKYEDIVDTIMKLKTELN